MTLSLEWRGITTLLTEYVNISGIIAAFVSLNSYIIIFSVFQGTFCMYIIRKFLRTRTNNNLFPFSSKEIQVKYRNNN